jgi:hypothetical protein
MYRVGPSGIQCRHLSLAIVIQSIDDITNGVFLRIAEHVCCFWPLCPTPFWSYRRKSRLAYTGDPDDAASWNSSGSNKLSYPHPCVSQRDMQTAREIRLYLVSCLLEISTIPWLPSRIYGLFQDCLLMQQFHQSPIGIIEKG